MQSLKVKLGKDGRILLPMDCRKKLQLEAGEELILRCENNSIHLVSANFLLKKAQQLVRSHAKDESLVKKLRSMRDKDALNEKSGK